MKSLDGKHHFPEAALGTIGSTVTIGQEWAFWRRFERLLATLRQTSRNVQLVCIIGRQLPNC